MPKPELLPPAELAAALANLPAWRVEQDALQRRYRFADFSSAFRFLTEVARLAEQQNHHPDFRCSYRIVDLSWTTHDCGGISALDLDLARQCDTAAAAFGVDS